MLEKDKNCIEFSMSSMMVTHKPYQEDTEIAIEGMAPGKNLLLANNPFDIPCDVVVVSKRYFERLQTENEELKKKLQVPDPFAEYKELFEKLRSKEDVEKFEWTLNHICGGQASANGWMVTAKLWRRNYETLSKLIGFSSVEEIQDYLTNEAECDTLSEAISKLKDQVKYTCDEWYSANSRNNSWKAAAECNSPHELIEKREALEKEIGVYSRTLNEWKEVTGCPSPSAAKTLIESGASWMSAYHSSCEVIKTWKKLTGCPTPIAAKTLIESGMSYEHGYHEVQEENRKLTEEVDSWKNVTGFSSPEDYEGGWQKIRRLCETIYKSNDNGEREQEWKDATGCVTPDQVKSRIEGLENAVRLTNRNLIKEIESNIDEWQKATGCSTPEQAKERIKALNERIDESEADYNHLLCTTGFESEGEIEDALDKCNHSTLRKALVDYEFDYEALLKFTGYKSEHDIRVILNGEKYQYKTMRELINSLERKVKFTESNWQKATGSNTPEEAEERIKHYKNRLGNAVQAASCAAKHLDNITF